MDLPLVIFTLIQGSVQETPSHIYFLFILCAEGLSRILLWVENEGQLKGVKICRDASPISHLMFADYLIIFNKTNLDDAAKIKDSLQCYSEWLGQIINYAKYAILFSPNLEP